MALYSTGMRRSERAGRLRIEDIDSERMIIARLRQARTRQIVQLKPLRQESAQRALDHLLLQVELHHFVRDFSWVFKHHRPDWR